MPRLKPHGRGVAHGLLIIAQVGNRGGVVHGLLLMPLLLLKPHVDDRGGVAHGLLLRPLLKRRVAHGLLMPAVPRIGNGHSATLPSVVILQPHSMRILLLLLKLLFLCRYKRARVEACHLRFLYSYTVPLVVYVGGRIGERQHTGCSALLIRNKCRYSSGYATAVRYCHISTRFRGKAMRTLR